MDFLPEDGHAGMTTPPLMEPSPDFAANVRTLFDVAASLSGCESAMLRLHAAGGDWIPVHACTGLTPEFMRDENIIASTECMCGRVARGDVDPSLFFFTPAGSFLTNDVDDLLARSTEEQLGPVRGRCISEGFKTIAAVPIRSDGEDIVGVLHLASRQRGRLAPGADEVLEALLAQAGAALTMPEYAEGRDRALLSSLTQALLPDPPATISGFALGVAHRGAIVTDAVGGDFYDVLDLGDGRLGVIVGDFSGHGIAAAGMAARCRLTLNRLFEETQDPAQALQRANSALASDIAVDKFVTVACVALDRASRAATVAVAGHPAPIVVGPETRAVSVAGSQVPLGVLETARYEASDISLADGEALVLYTDGVTDARDVTGSFFGPAQLLEVCAELAPQPPGQIAEEACAASDAFASLRVPGDDKLVLVVRAA